MRKSQIWVTLVLMFGLALPTQASSHREAPGITKRPQVDGTDFYMFRSYESGREDFVTIVANYNPLQDPYGGPNYFPLDAGAFYDIHIDNDGDCSEDLTFRFRYRQSSPFIALDIGDPGEQLSVPIPLSNVSAFGAGDEAGLNVRRSFRLNMIQGAGPITATPVQPVKNVATGGVRFDMPFDNIGTKSIPDYDTYAAQFIHDIDIPGCATNGRAFVGQRRESFAVNLGETFDLVNLNPVGEPNAEASTTEDKNITTFALELPIDCLTDGSSVIAGWTSAKLRQRQTIRTNPNYNRVDSGAGARAQVSRLANPLVNELVIGLPDKDRFNSSHPSGDGQFLNYVTHPTLPELLQVLFGVTAPNAFPRDDLVQIFLTGVSGLNVDGGTCEIMRLNTSISAVARELQNPLGVIAGDNAGYPNGRRPGDDTVDISLRAVMGVLLDAKAAPSGDLAYTDGAVQNALQFDEVFPYLRTPYPGSPNETTEAAGSAAARESSSRRR